MRSLILLGTFALIAARSLDAQSGVREVASRMSIPETRVAEQWTLLGHAQYDTNLFKDAIASFEQAMQLGIARPDDAAWNVARAYARLGNRKQSLRWLAYAKELGFPVRAMAVDEPAFTLFRRDPEFLRIIAISPGRGVSEKRLVLSLESES